jgi:hypothetical protein
MADYKKTEWARKTLDLPHSATMKEIKDAYKSLCLKYHPDRDTTGKNQKEYSRRFNEITQAYNFLMAYCTNYPFSFRKEETKKVIIEEDYHALEKNFYEEW